MRSKFLLFPAAIVAAAPAFAGDYMTLEQAQQLIFPGATFASADFTLTDADADKLAELSGTIVFRNKVRAWRASTGDWFFLDQVPGRDDHITYAIGITADGKVQGIEILLCLPEYGGIRQLEWRRQFVGRTYREGQSIGDILNISGTTLSTIHITDGVKRMLATYALFVAPSKG